MTTRQIADEHRSSLVALGWSCTAVEENWQDGSCKFVSVDPRTDAIATRKVSSGGTLSVTKL